jgi:hypothetical protein
MGVFALRPIAQGEVMVVWGGRIISGEQLARLAPGERCWMLQIDDDLYQLTDADELGPADHVNHSCAPNCGILGQITLVAMRPIAAGEEICFDYAMTDSTPHCEFDCWCGSPGCRGAVRAGDWRRPELRRRYGRFFSAYLLRRMEAEGVPAGVVEVAKKRRVRLVAAGAPADERVKRAPADHSIVQTGGVRAG